MTDYIDIECPNCGRTIRSNVEKCPYCCAQLEFHDIHDLERVANGLDIEEKACTPEVDDQGDAIDRKGIFGKLFARGRK